MIVVLISVAIALGISALCSLLEAITLSLTPGQVNHLTKIHPRAGETWKGFKARIDRPIAVILILNTAAHTIGATIAGAKFKDEFGDASLIWFSLLFTYLMLQFTEILPKTLGVRFNHRLAPLVAFPLKVLIQILSPVLWLIQLVNRPFERRSTSGHSSSTLEEIAALAGLARIGGLLGEHQERIIRGASRLSGLTAGEVMIPAHEVSFLSTDQSLADAIMLAHEDPHTRFPIHAGPDRNQVIGYVNFKEMIYWAQTNPLQPGLTGIVRPVHFTSPDTLAPKLLEVFVEQHEHLAIVRSVDGLTLGLVTLEDLIEELVGELEDEFDRMPRMLHRLPGGTWMVGGGVLIRDLAGQLKLQLSGMEGTLSAWLIARLGRVPKRGELYREAGYQFLIRRIRRGKVFEVAVTPDGQNPNVSMPVS